jgi:UDPglucose 6-dehydrogenase
MSVESAEMTKHALNAYLATSVAFANEVAVLCEQAGADAKEVERGLKSDIRIGPRAYLSPGEAFAGGTLARDVMFLERLGTSANCPTHLISAVRTSNNEHKNWVRHKLRSLLGNLCDQRVTVWGLTYKPGTDTLRRSGSVELCEWLAGQGAMVRAHDPAVKVMPEKLSGKIELTLDPILALKDASALVIATEWPDYRSIDSEAVVSQMIKATVIDSKRFLEKTLGSDPQIQYITIGKQTRPIRE